MCWECPAMSGPVPTCDFTSPGVSQAFCANQQFIHGSESGCAQDTGCTNSNKASIQTCIFYHHLSQTYCSSCCAGKDVSDAATQSRVVCVSHHALLWAGWGMKAIPLVVHILHSVHLEDVVIVGNGTEHRTGRMPMRDTP